MVLFGSYPGSGGDRIVIFRQSSKFTSQIFIGLVMLKYEYPELVTLYTEKGKLLWTATNYLYNDEDRYDSWSGNPVYQNKLTIYLY